MAEFSKEELLDIIHIQQKTSQQLEAIVQALSGCAERQNRMLSILENGIARKIIESLDKGCVDCRHGVRSINRDVMWLKIFLGLIGMAAFISFVFNLMHH